MLSVLAVCYLFFGGAGAGALAILSLVEALRAAHVDFASAFAPNDLLARAWLACIFFLSMGVACLAADLGRLDHAWKIFFLPHFTPLTIGAYALAASCVIAAFFAFARWSDAVFSTSGMVFLLAVVGVLAGVVTMSYTGVLLQGMASVVAWQTPVLPLLFASSSLSCGVALALGASSFSDSRFPPLGFFKGLLRFDSVLILAESVFVAALIASMLFDESSCEGAWALLTGSLSPLFWLGLVFVGLVAPFVLERFVSYASHRFQFLWIALCVLSGGFALRWCVVAVAAFDPSQAYAVL